METKRLALVRARIKADEDYQTETEGVLEGIKGKPLDEEEKEDREINFYRETGKLGGIKASREKVSLNVIDITPGQAKRILKIIKEKETKIKGLLHLRKKGTTT